MKIRFIKINVVVNHAMFFLFMFTKKCRNSKHFAGPVDARCYWSYRAQGLSRNASSVSFGHAEHCFLTVWTPKSLSEFAKDDFS